MSKPIIIGIAGGSGSGKSTVTQEIYQLLKAYDIRIIQQDSYYKDQSTIPFEERIKTNYDHPFSFDNDLLIEHLNALKENKAIEKPIYDFSIHNRIKETERVEPAAVIIIEGILIFADERIRELCDIKIFVDTDSDVRIIRRILRDMKERGRTLDSVILQYLNTVRPAHMQFCEPTKRYADIIIPEGGYNKVAIDAIVAMVKSLFN